MDRLALVEELKNIIAPYLKERGVILVDLICRHEGRDLVVRILADKEEGGITLGECASLNNELGTLLDQKDILKQRYILEVSSPGLDRPLKNKNDFLCCINKEARFFLSEPIDGEWEIEGVIREVGEDRVFLDINGRALALDLTKIRKAKQVF